MHKVLNIRNPNDCPSGRIPDDARYVGRPRPGLPPSRLGNPFKAPRDGSREEVYAKFDEWFTAQLEADEDLRDYVDDLRGWRLVCWCSPAPWCHAWRIYEEANRPR